MTISKHIAAIRVALNEFDEKKAPFSDEAIFVHFKAAASYLTRNKYNQYAQIDPWSLRQYCIKMESAKSHDCSCVPAGCTVLRSVNGIPRPIFGRGRSYLWVSLIDHSNLTMVHPSYVKDYKYEPIFSGKITWSLINKHIVLWNADTKNIRPLTVLVNTLSEDPTEWAEVTQCAAEGEELGNCYDIDADDYPIDADLVDAAYRRTVELLFNSLQVPDDVQAEGY